MISAREAAPAPDYSTTLNDESRPLPERLAAYGRAVAAEQPGDTEEVAVHLEFYAALLRSPDALQRYAGSRERRLQDLAEADDADDDDLAADARQVDAWVIGQALGMILATGATDPNSGPLLILLALAYWPAGTPTSAFPAPGPATPAPGEPEPARGGDTGLTA